MIADTPVWVDELGAVAAALSAFFVFVGGLWAYFKFRKDAPYIARTNVTVTGELVTDGPNDLLRVTCSASTVGRGGFKFDREENRPPGLDIEALTSASLEADPYGGHWRASQDIFRMEVSVASGEVLNDMALVFLGPRQPNTVAYRVLMTMTARDEDGGDAFTWRAADIVLVEGLLPKG